MTEPTLSLKDAQYLVRQFMERAGQVCPDEPTVPAMDVALLRLALIREEAHEFWVTVDALYAFPKDELLVQFADHIGDLLYVVLGAAVALGIDIAPVFETIHASNMTKFIDGSLREDGKWVKGPSYRAAEPYIQRIIRDQMA